MIRFEPQQGIRHVVIVGLGGTGSQLARSVARILYDMRRNNLAIPSMTLVDPDRIEEKNCGRQMFSPGADIGQYKAELLARRFNAALGLDIAWDNAAFDPDKHVQPYGTLLIGCVDNHLARQALAQVTKALWLDQGNHAQSGQVIIGTTYDPQAVRNALHAGKEVISELPNAALIFPELLRPEETSTPDTNASCAELAELGLQHLLVNDAIATAASNYVYRLLYRKPLNSFMSWVSLEAVRPVPISREEIEPYLDRAEAS